MKQQYSNTKGDLTRREFLATGLGMAAAPLLTASAPSEPILDLHQHTLYAGRSDQQLIAHQRYHSVTVTNLLAGDVWLLSELGGNADCAALQAKSPISLCALPALTQWKDE